MTEQKDKKEEMASMIYSSEVINFTTAAANLCLTLEKCTEMDKETLIDTLLSTLSLLYYHAQQLKMEEVEYEINLEKFVVENDYNAIKNTLENILEADDAYLEVFHVDMAYSDTPILSSISENMADIYQELKDYLANFQIGVENIMEDAIHYCLEAFGEHWGQKLCNVLRALNNIKYNHSTDENLEADSTETGKIDRDSFLQFQALD